MTISELIKALQRLKVETESFACLGCGHEHNCGIRGCAIIREAAERLGDFNAVFNEETIVRLAGRCLKVDPGRLRELAEADRVGRMVVPCWIPVTERLPEDSVKECIIFVPHIPGNIVGLGRYLGSGRWVLDGWYLTPEAVAYWMPLPEAPHEKALEAMKDE